MSLDLSGRPVLVTGASGFIGCRLAEKLALQGGARVRAMVTDHARAVRVARLNVDLISADIANPEEVLRAVAGCDVVFHCAYGSRGSPERRREVDVEGTRHVLEASRRSGVRRVVHVSTVAVYGIPSDGDLDEEAPRKYSGNAYGESKLDAEKAATEYGRRGLPVVILQPTVVYGPFGPFWTRSVLERLKSQRIILVDRGEGICNAVYVDDVVDALLLAATTPGIDGETFLVSGPEPTTWKEFYAAFERMLGRPGTVSMSWEDAVAHAARGTRRRGGRLRVIPVLGRHPGFRRAIRSVGSRAALSRIARRVAALVIDGAPTGSATGKGKSRFTASQGRVPDLPLQRLDAFQADLFRARARVRIDRARRLLGYRPRFDLELGMSSTETWARWAGLLDGEDR